MNQRKVGGVHSKTLSQVLNHGSPGLLVVTEAAPEDTVATVRTGGHEVLVVPMDADGHADVGALLWTLGRRGLRSVLVEGGQGVYTAFLRAGVVDRVHCFMAPRILGGGALSWAGSLGIASVASSITLKGVRTRRLGPDVLVEGWLTGPPATAARAAR